MSTIMSVMHIYGVVGGEGEKLRKSVNLYGINIKNILIIRDHSNSILKSLTHGLRGIDSLWKEGDSCSTRGRD